jgi:hypothetical protein
VEACKGDALLCQAVEVRGPDNRAAYAEVDETNIVTDDKQDIGSILLCQRDVGQTSQQADEGDQSC